MTTSLCVDADRQIHAAVIAKTDPVVSGGKPFNRVFQKVDDSVTLQWAFQEGDLVKSGTTLVTLSGNARSC